MISIKTLFLSLSLFYLVNQNGCAQETSSNRQGAETMPEKEIEVVLREHTDSLMAIPGVVGTGQGRCNGEPCIKIYVAKMTAELEQKLPRKLEGYTVEVEVTGGFRALPRE